MRKAFDANVPKLKPRLRASAVGVNPSSPSAEENASPTPAISLTPTLSLSEGEGKYSQGKSLSPRGAVETPAVKSAPLSPTGGEGRVRGQPSAVREREVRAPGISLSPTLSLSEGEGKYSQGKSLSPRGPGAREHEGRSLSPRGAGGEGAGEGGDPGSFDARRDRLEKIKRRVAEAARPRAATITAPVDSARAAESVLGLVRDLESDLAGARAREDALRADLEASRAEATRAGAEARGAVERLGVVEGELETKRGVLSELLAEMGALEAERDEALRRSQGFAALDEERARLLEDLARRADDEAKLRAEREAEVVRLSEELRAGAADGARLRGALAQLARERDDAAGELERVRRERDELGSAKRALEQVHTALAQARARLG